MKTTFPTPIACLAGSAALAIFSLGSSTAFAQTLTINLVVSNIVHHFTPPEFPLPGYVNDELIFDKAGLTNVNLSSYQSFELRLFAPSGKIISVNRSTNYSSAANIYYFAGGDSSSHTEPATLSFENLSGSRPITTYSLFYIGDAGNVLKFWGMEDYTNAISFTAMKYDFTPAWNPANSPKTFTSRSDQGFPVVFGYSTAQTNDPGPFVTMTPSKLTINLVVSNIVHHFTPPEFPLPGYVNDELIFDKAGLTNVNLSSYQSFELRLFAPNGKIISVNRSTNYSSAANIYYLAGGDSSSHTEPATLSFENFSGSMPINTYSFFCIGDAGNMLNFWGMEDYTNAISFTAMKYDFTPAWNPANSPKTFTSQSSQGFPVTFWYSTAQTTDPGPFVTMTAPQLIIRSIMNQIVVSWSPSAIGWTLQTNNSLAAGTWGNYAGPVINNSVTNSPLTGYRFFRLKQ